MLMSPTHCIILKATKKQWSSFFLGALVNKSKATVSHIDLTTAHHPFHVHASEKGSQ